MWFTSSASDERDPRESMSSVPYKECSPRLPTQRMDLKDEFINNLFYFTGGNSDIVNEQIRIGLAGITDERLKQMLKENNYNYIQVALLLNLLPSKIEEL